MQNIFREFVFILFYRARLIVMVFLAVFLVSLAFSVTLPSVYRSTAKFSMTIPASFDPLQQESSYDYRNRMRRVLLEQKELVLSSRVLARVVQDLYPDAKQTTAVTKAIDDLRTKLDVIPPGGETFEGSSVFIVEVNDGNPSWATKAAQSVTQAYLDAYRSMTQSKSDFSHSFFTEQTEKLNNDLMDKQNKLREFETKQALALLEILNLGEGKANVEVGPNALLTQFLRNYHDLQTELAGLQASIASLEREAVSGEIPVVLPEMEVTGRSITLFKNKVAHLQIQLNEMKPQFTENFEPMKQIEQELKLSVDSLKKELRRTVSAQKITAQSIKARIGQLEKIIQDLRDRVHAIAQEKATHQTLVQEFNLAKEAYTRARAQLEQARMASSLNQDKQSLTLIDKPSFPLKPFKPNRFLIGFGGLLAGIFLGIAAALTVDHFDHRMKTIYEIERQLSIPVLGSIPSV